MQRRTNQPTLMLLSFLTAMNGVAFVACGGSPDAPDAVGGSGGAQGSGGGVAGVGGAVGSGSASSVGGQGTGGDPGEVMSGGGAPAAGGFGGLGGWDGMGGSDGAGGATTGGCDLEPPLDVIGPVILPLIELNEPAPVPTGGTLNDGVYDLVSYVFYEDFSLDSLGDDFRQVVRVRDGGAAMDNVQDGVLGRRERSYTVVDREGTLLTVAVTCPQQFAGSITILDYSATPGVLVLYIDYGVAVAVATHALRE